MIWLHDLAQPGLPCPRYLFSPPSLPSPPTPPLPPLSLPALCLPLGGLPLPERGESPPVVAYAPGLSGFDFDGQPLDPSLDLAASLVCGRPFIEP